MNCVVSFEQLNKSDTFNFECKRCSKCCRNIESHVMVESLDLFRMSRELNTEPGEIANHYTDVCTLAWGVPVLMLKSEYAYFSEFGQILKYIPRNKENAVLELMVLYRYFLFDTDIDFLPQYERNMAQLRRKLVSMT